MSDIVTIEGAVKTFRRGKEEIHALDGIDLSLAEGEYLAVVGPSGSGKTTLLNLIGCVDRPSDGRVNVRGMETELLTERALATIRSTTIGFVFQQFFLVPTLTAVENVMLPEWFSPRHNGRDTEQKARELLKDVGLENRADHYPNELSGGEMQRVALARALINEPEILLADEPTGNLDTKSAEEISKILKKLNDRGLTIVIVTHNADLAAFGTRFIALKDGKITEERRLRPIPEPVLEAAATVPDRVAAETRGLLETEPHDLVMSEAVPEYMPSTIIKKTWGSWRVSALIVLLGGLMCAAAAMPFVGAQTGFGLLRQSFFTLTIYRGDALTQVVSGRPALIFTGTWPVALGALVVASGILYVLKRQLISGWIAAIAGLVASAIALVNLLMSLILLRPDVATGFQGMSPGSGTWLFLATAVATTLVGIIIIVRRRRGARAATA